MEHSKFRGERDQIKCLWCWWSVLQKWQETLEFWMFGGTKQFKDELLERCQMCSGITHCLYANVTIWQSHGRASIDNHVHIVTLWNGIQSSLSHADVCFTSVKNDVLPVHFRDDWIDSGFKHWELFLLSEHLDTVMVLCGNDGRYGTEVDLSSSYDRNVENLSNWRQSACVVRHCVESKDVLCKSILNITLEEDCVLLGQSTDSLRH